MTSPSRTDSLETWMLGVKDLAASRGYQTRLAYADRVAGDALVLALDDGERDQLVELWATRRPRGRAQLAVIATSATAVSLARDRLSRAHAEISRLANARRKFVHRYVRLVEQLAASFVERTATAPGPPLEQLRGVLPEAVAATGVGFHVELASEPDERVKEKYPTLHGAAVLVDGRWHVLPYDPRRQGWAPRPAAHATLLATRPGLDGGKAGIVVETEVASAIEPGAALAAAAATALVVDETKRQKSDAWWWTDCIEPCSIIDVCNVGSALGDLGNCVPDCNFDLDCGAVDCSW